MMTSLNNYIKIFDDRKSNPVFRLGKSFFQQGRFHGDDTHYGVRF